MKLTRRAASCRRRRRRAPAAPAGAERHALYLDTKDGRITIKLRPDLAPKHVERIETLAKGISTTASCSIASSTASWPRPAIRPAPASGRSDLPNLPAEFTEQPFKRGTVGMARSQRPEFGQFAVLHLLRRRAGISTGNTRSGAKSSPAWTSSTRSRRATRPTMARSTNPDKIIKCASPAIES